MEKTYCAVNTKYYKNSNRGEISHVLRSFAENVNAYEELSPNNFGFSFGNCDIDQHYENLLSQAKQDNKFAIQKDSNTFIDSVLIFNSDRFFECMENGKKNEIEEATKAYMLEFKALYGFEPVGFKFHLDEGTVVTADNFQHLDEKEQKKYRPIENDDNPFVTEYIKHNIHAHAIFLNYDFEKKKTCLRNMNRSDWGDSQDLLHKHFKTLGFERGEKKQTKKRDRKEKAEYVREQALKIEDQDLKIKEQEKELRTLKFSKLKLSSQYGEALDEIVEAEERLLDFDSVKDNTIKIKAFFDKNKKFVNSIESYLGENNFMALKLKLLSIYNAIVGTEKPEIDNVVSLPETIELEQLNSIREELERDKEPEITQELQDKNNAEKVKKIEQIKSKRKYGKR